MGVYGFYESGRTNFNGGLMASGTMTVQAISEKTHRPVKVVANGTEDILANGAAFLGTGFLLAAVLFVLLFVTLAPVAGARTLSEHGAWTAFRTDETSGPVCYVGAEPRTQEGNYTRRGDPYALVVHRPSLGENDVVSVQAGYTYKAKSEVEIRIDRGEPVKLFTMDTRAWAYDSASDVALVKAMKRGSIMVVIGTSSRGTLTTDTYSLNGFTATYNDARKACGL